MRGVSGLLVAGLLAGLSGCTPAPTVPLKPPYVPTAPGIVEAMLALAEPAPGDVVYDLGSGDGRIPIAAVARFGVRQAVGIEIDPRLVRLSRDNARMAGVSDRVRFVRGDILTADFREASIVTLFLLSDMNMRLRPRLLAELKPGARIVAHMFGLGDWRPDREIAVVDPDPEGMRFMETDSNPVYLYIVPAAIEGRWRVSADRTEVRLALTRKFQDVAGTVHALGLAAPVRNGRVTGSRLRFDAELQSDGGLFVLGFDGRVDGERLTGRIDIAGMSLAAAGRREP